MNQLITPDLLHKYIDGNCTAQEVAVVYQWYDSFENGEDPFDTLNDVEQEALRLLMLNKFKASVAVPYIIEAVEPRIKKVTFIKFAYALSGIAALLLAVFGIYYNNRKAATFGPDRVITFAAEQMVLTNQSNSIYKQTLCDGSTVWLSPGSQLEYPKKFIGQYRQVKMSGEAFFEISKDHTHPFIIYSGGVITRVWGTSFRIRAYKNVPTEVSVVTGKVSVKLAEKDGSEVMLFPTQKVVYRVNTGLLLRSKETLHSTMRMWQKTTVSFEDIPLDDVLTMLNKHFGTRLYTNDKELGKYPLHADFTDQNLASILDMLESSLNVGYKMDDIEIELYRKPIMN